MSAWRLVANFAVPPALVLTVLIILPLPRTVKKGLLLFAKSVLNFPLAGTFRLGHVMVVITGMALVASSIQTYKLASDAADAHLTPNQRTGILARKWREERNFWLAANAFLLWAILQRAYSLMLELTVAQERVRSLELQLNTGLGAKQGGRNTGNTTGTGAGSITSDMPPKVAEYPSAPPLPAGVKGKDL